MKKEQKYCFACGTEILYTKLDMLKSIISKDEIQYSIICPVCGKQNIIKRGVFYEEDK